MKCIHIFNIVFLVVVALPLEVLACDEQRRILAAAEQALDEAVKEYRDLTFRSGMLIDLPSPPPNSNSNSPEDLGSSLGGDALKEQRRNASKKRDKARLARDSAQFQLDQCLKPDKAACGHDMPGHLRRLYSGCNHSDYTCKADNHLLQSCPTDQGRSCDYQTYRPCTPHTHAYSGEALRACGHSVSESGSHYVTRFSDCGHYGYVCKSSQHTLTSCPSGPNGETCTALTSISGGTSISGQYLPCKTIHVHSYSIIDSGTSNSPSQNLQTNPEETITSPIINPAPTLTPTPPLPEPELRVACPANGWTNCGGTYSHATRCAAGHLYYTCNSGAVSYHSGHTTPTPTLTPRPVPAPEPRVVCPANGWTNCQGAVSHAKTCGRGHTYYTCNPSAVDAHSWH